MLVYPQIVASDHLKLKLGTVPRSLFQQFYLSCNLISKPLHTLTFISGGNPGYICIIIELEQMNIDQHVHWLIEHPIFLAACLPDLSTLQMGHNKLETAADLEHLVECHKLSVLDISHNRIDDPAVLDILERMTSLVRIMIKNGLGQCSWEIK